MNLSESRKQGNYQEEETAETQHWDWEPEHQQFSAEREETHNFSWDHKGLSQTGDA